jgi:hypothetical protein
LLYYVSDQVDKFLQRRLFVVSGFFRFFGWCELIDVEDRGSCLVL